MARLQESRWRLAAVLGVAAGLTAVLVGASQIAASDAKTAELPDPPQAVESRFSGSSSTAQSLARPRHS